MDFFQLECFNTVARTNSFTEASYALSISQSSISKYIRRLEEELEVELIDRSRRTIKLTQAGEEFLIFSEHTLQELQITKEYLKKYSQQSELRLGCIENISNLGITDMIVQFMKQHPDIEVKLRESDTLTLMDGLMKNESDIVIAAEFITPDGRSNLSRYPMEHYETHLLFEDEMCAVIHDRHPLSGQMSITWEALAEEPLLLLDGSYSSNKMIKSVFSGKELDPYILFEYDQVETILGMVSSGYGVAVVSKKVAENHEHTKILHIEEPIYRKTILVVPRETHMKSVQLFKNYIIST